MSMKQRKIREMKRKARREFINALVNSIPAPKIFKGLLSTLSLNLMFAGALAYIVILFVSGM